VKITVQGSIDGTTWVDMPAHTSELVYPVVYPVAQDAWVKAVEVLQWGSCDGCNTNDSDDKRQFCPACGGSRPQPWDEDDYPVRGHKDGCWVGALVSEAKESGT
jgi:hypothetical protein